MSESPLGSSQQLGDPLYRKCMGKTPDDCYAYVGHNNSRWECSFETMDREEFLRHVKNINRRNRWRELISAAKPDPAGLYHCVYFSTDRHHVENHYKYATPEHQALQQQLREQNASNTKKSQQQRKWAIGSLGVENEEDDDENDSHSNKKIRLLDSPPDEGADAIVEKLQALPDRTKISELMDQIERKLEIPHDMCINALDKLEKEGFVIVGPLKTLTKEAWMRIDLPLAIEEELKNLVFGRVFPQYSTTIPLVQINPFPQLWGQPIVNAQPVYFPTDFYPTDTHDENEEDEENDNHLPVTLKDTTGTQIFNHDGLPEIHVDTDLHK